MSTIPQPYLYSRAEVQERFLKHISGLIDYWAAVRPSSSRMPSHHQANWNLRAWYQDFFALAVVSLARWGGIQFGEAHVPNWKD